MSNFNPRIVLPLVMLILVSGCVGLPDVFGRDVISIQQSVVENGVRDVIVVKDIQTIPKSPLLPNQQVLLLFVIENRDALKSSSVFVDLFNAPTMRSAGGSLCNLYTVPPPFPGTQGGCTAGEECYPAPSFCPGDGSYTPCNNGQGTCCTPSTIRPEIQRYCLPDNCGPGGCTILPGEEKPVTFTLRTPAEGEIKNIKTDTKLNFKTAYNFEGSLTYLVPAVSTDEIVRRQRSGDKAELFTSKSHGSGPVQIDAELQGAPYMLSDISRTVESVLLFKIKNRGSGNLLKSQVDTGSMEIVFPPEIVVDTKKSSEKFTCVETVTGTRCRNDKKKNNEELGVIPLYKDESRSSLYFTVTLRQPLQEPFRSFRITATVVYIYELRNSIDMTINPFQNV